LAQQLKYSFYGEMFSAFELAHLAKEYYQLEAQVINQFSIRDIFTSLQQGALCLIP